MWNPDGCHSWINEHEVEAMPQNLVSHLLQTDGSRFLCSQAKKQGINNKVPLCALCRLIPFQVAAKPFKFALQYNFPFYFSRNYWIAKVALPMLRSFFQILYGSIQCW